MRFECKVSPGTERSVPKTKWQDTAVTTGGRLLLCLLLECFEHHLNVLGAPVSICEYRYGRNNNKNTLLCRPYCQESKRAGFTITSTRERDLRKFLVEM